MVQTQTFTVYRKWVNEKILWDFNIQKDNTTEHRRPDMIIINKTSKKAHIVGFTVPADHRIQISRQRKIENYQDPKRELQKLENLETSIVPTVIGTLGTIPKSLEKHPNELNVEVNISHMQTTVSLNSARIISKVLEFYGVLLTQEL